MARAWLRRLRVGVTGIGNSGKSVFLTSLVSHLQDHDPDRLRLGADGSARVHRFRLLSPAHDEAAFDVDGFRRTLVDHGRWPRKTRAESHLRCAFERSDWRLLGAELHLFDFPGERMADAAMLGRDFADWSDAVLGPLMYDRPTAELASRFLAALEQQDPTEASLLAGYRDALARLTLAFRSRITPSTFLLGEDGVMARSGPPEAIAAERVSGLPGAEFAPLPVALRERRPDLYWRFSERYLDYRERVVTPVFAFLRRCHRLVVLVDLPGILMGGTGRYNDQRELLKVLFAALDPHRGVTDRLIGMTAEGLSAGRLRPGGITRVSLIASKADLVHPSDRGRLLALLRDMARRPAEDHGGWRASFHTASAIVSTRPAPGDDHALIGRTLLDGGGDPRPPDAPALRYAVSAVPESWPESWEPGDYLFPDVYPEVPRRIDLPPKQFGLDGVLEAVLADGLLE